MLRSLELILTAACNLKCGYCYQNDKKARRMTWETARSALDMAVESEAPQVQVRFIGGEPLLELPTIRRAVEYLTDRTGPEKSFSFAISTNGVLVDGDVLTFLAEHDFETQLSFDGVRDAQDVRGPGTFARLDALLDQTNREYPGFFRHNLHVALTLHSGNLARLADSIEYFLKKDVARIRIAPLMTHDSGWQRDDIQELDRQFERIFSLSIAHHRQTGRIPVELFRREDRGTAAGRSRRDEMCGAPRGAGIAVDVDGQVTGCVTFAQSYQQPGNEFLRDQLEMMRMGSLTDARFSQRLALYPAAARLTGLFHGKDKKYSSYRRCGNCEYVNECSICPMSIGHIPGNTDPDRVPDLPCAYNMVGLEYRSRFPAQPSALEIMRGEAPVPEAVTKFLTAAAWLRS